LIQLPKRKEYTTSGEKPFIQLFREIRSRFPETKLEVIQLFREWSEADFPKQNSKEIYHIRGEALYVRFALF